MKTTINNNKRQIIFPRLCIMTLVILSLACMFLLGACNNMTNDDFTDDFTDASNVYLSRSVIAENNQRGEKRQFSREDRLTRRSNWWINLTDEEKAKWMEGRENHRRHFNRTGERQHRKIHS